ncbi:SMP-30/gluconolactonase/LRE family protein [Longivirga aurantiaca]|uniref:SMP-30/gluconolactonase/LRE family protein n=1 Tax=Longivirga aurantiaca TaxID=1837743 RepID=A0ABW1T4C7_9ACTN
MTTWDADVATTASYELGEGPVWDPERAILRWVDILGGRVHVGSLDDGGGVHEQASFSLAYAPATLGAVAAPAFLDHEPGTLLAAHDRLVFVDVDGGEHLVAVLCADEPRRLNDGVTDPLGRYLVGSAPTGERTFAERLWLVDHDGTVTVLDDDLGLSNGLAFSADGGTLFSVDTFSHVVRVRPYDAVTGTAGGRSDFVRVDDGFPDGIALDADGHLWVAVFGQGEVRRFSPEGTLVDVVRTPGAPQATNVAFAGEDRRTLVITTARENMTAQDVADHPRSGRLFTTRVDVPGLPARPWRGTT